MNGLQQQYVKHYVHLGGRRLCPRLVSNPCHGVAKLMPPHPTSLNCDRDTAAYVSELAQGVRRDLSVSMSCSFSSMELKSAGRFLETLDYVGRDQQEEEVLPLLQSFCRIHAHRILDKF